MSPRRALPTVLLTAIVSLTLVACSASAPAQDEDVVAVPDAGSAPDAGAAQEGSASLEVPAGWPAWIPLDGASSIKIVNEVPAEIVLYVTFPNSDAFHEVTAAIVASGCTKNPYEYAEMTERVLDCVLGPEHIWLIGRNDFSGAEMYYHPVYPLS